LTKSDAKNYNQHITGLEKEQKEFLHISKEEMTVLKSAITQCHVGFQNAEALTKHEDVQHEHRVSQCNKCKQIIVREGTIYRRMSLRSEDKLFMCNICKKKGIL
jgi:hypothetical protein